MTDYEELLEALKTTRIVDHNGDERWSFDGEYHRTGGPAVIWNDGSKFWYRYGRLHRTDGPAAVYADGRKRWWLNGQEQSHRQWSLNRKKMSKAKLEENNS